MRINDTRLRRSYEDGLIQGATALLVNTTRKGGIMKN